MKPSLVRWLLVLIFLLAVFIRLNGITTSGEYWDEAAVAGPGSQYLEFIARGDFSSESWSLNKEHPPVAKYLYGATKILPKYFPAIAQIDSEYLPGKQYTAGRVLSALLGSLAVLILFLLGRALYDDKVGLLAASILALLPHVVGHDRIIGLETPLLLFTLIAVLFFVRQKWVLTGFFFGLAIATRFNAVLMVPFFVVGIILMKRGEILKPLLSIFGVGGLVLFISWPWLWSDPVRHLLQSLSMSTVGQGEYFLGSLRALPWYYYITYFLVTTPVLILVLTSGFLAKIVKNREPKDLILLTYFSFPFLASFFSLKQDGIRYIYQFYPALALMAAVGFVFFLNRLETLVVLKRCHNFKLLLSAIMLIPLFCTVLRVSPFGVDYYNWLVGGPKQVFQHRWFEIGWWGEGIYPAVMWVNQNAEPGASVNYAFSPQHVAPKLRADLELSTGTLDKQYVIKNTYADWYKEVALAEIEYEKVFEVKVSGASLATVFKRKAL